MDLHWLRVPECVKFKLCVLIHRCLTGAAPRYMTELAVPVASTARRRLRSVSSADLVVPSTRRSTIGDRAFAVAGPRAWNSLPSDIRTSTPSFDTFKKHLKSYQGLKYLEMATAHFQISFPFYLSPPLPPFPTLPLSSPPSPPLRSRHP